MASILVIDDEETYRRQLSIILTREGHEVRTACDGREGIAIGLCCSPHVLLVDWALIGDCDGLAVAETLQREQVDLQVIPITGHCAADLKRQAKCRLFQVLEKPFGISDVIGAVRGALTEYGVCA